MDPDKIRFEIRRLFKPSERKQYFILEAPGIQSLIIPESLIRELPHKLKRKFFMQQGISLKMIFPALNDWIKDNHDHSS